MTVARWPDELERAPRAVAIGTFDGMHLGHRAVVGAAVELGMRPTVVTFHPHPRTSSETVSSCSRRSSAASSC